MEEAVSAQSPIKAQRNVSPDDKFKADDFLALRFPVLPSTLLPELAAAGSNDLEQTLRRHIGDPYVREALYLASPALYERMCAWEQGEGTFNGLPQTIARYLLRMAFRATPFGTFSCVSTCRAQGDRTQLALPARRDMKRIVQLDSTVLSRFAQLAQATDSVRRELRYAPNDTMLAQDDSVAFTTYQRNGRGKRVYRRVEVERSPYLDAIIDISRPGLTVAEIVAAAAPRFAGEATADELEAFVWELVTTQVLCCDQLVDITSDDALAHLIANLPPDSQLHQALGTLAQDLEGLCGTAPVALPESYGAVLNGIFAAGVRVEPRRATKVDLYAVEEVSGVVGTDVMRDVERVVNALSTLTKKTRLAKLVKLFGERFGESEVPLLVVAEELESLGFSDKDASSPALVRLVTGAKKRAQRSPSNEGPKLADKLVERALNPAAETYVDISDLLGEKSASNPLPGTADATVVAWLSLWRKDDVTATRPVVEVRSVGSQEPGRIMGRFAQGIPAIAEYLRNSADESDDLVAEIVHLPEDRLGNISSRPVTARYELRMRGGGSQHATRLALDDLMVSVVNERVCIRSRSLGRNIALRMSNAHGFDQPENLPIYRFLNHVSNQDYNAELVSLRRRIPDARFIPGLQYRGVIVGRPTWLFSGDMVQRLKKTPRQQLPSAFQAMRAELGLPAWVALVQGDNIIPYHLDNEWMVEDLLRSVLKSDEVTLTDVHPDGMQPYLESEAGRHFHEIQVALRTRRQRRQRGASRLPTSHRQAVVPVWGRWAYLKLYTSAHLQDAVLSQLRPSLNRLVAASKAQRFFFIRYRDEGGAHLRLRLESSQGGALESVMPELRPVLDDLLRRRIIQNVTIEPYIRETARYGGYARCALCEEIFFIDSLAVLDCLPEFNAGSVEAWRTAAMSIDAMLQSFGLRALEQRLAFARRAASDFEREMKFGSAERKKIGELYGASKALFKDGALASDIAGAKHFIRVMGPIAAVWARMGAEQAQGPLSAEQAYGIQWSLIHMRLNRLFNRDPRLQEAIVWELLKRSYASAVHRAAPAKQPVLEG